MEVVQLNPSIRTKTLQICAQYTPGHLCPAQEAVWAGQSPSFASLPLPCWVLSQLIALGSILEISDGDIITDHRKATD